MNSSFDSRFRLYNGLSSSFFDMIDGNRETQQTKGLGLVLARSKKALYAFLSIESVREAIDDTNVTLDTCDRLIVNCELISKSDKKLRADIVLRFYRNKRPVLAILIEAKSASKAISASQAVNQTKKYLDHKFDELEEFGEMIVGITLTKLKKAGKNSNLVSITRSDIIEAFYYANRERNSLFDDYFKFLTNINGTMKFYEAEVFSIPTDYWSIERVEEEGVYECPNHGRYIIKRKPLFLAFRRRGGGEMEEIFKVEDIILLNFSEDYEGFLKDENYSRDIRKRVREYAEHLLSTKRWTKMPTDEKQVFLLDKSEVIPLPLKPRPSRNNSFRAYYRLSELLQNEIVTSE